MAHHQQVENIDVKRKRKESVKVVLARRLNEDNKFIKVFISKRNFDKYPKIGILLSECERYAFIIFDNIIANKIIKYIEKIINNDICKPFEDISIKTDNRGRELRISCINSDILIKIIASEFLYANITMKDLEWLLNSLKEAQKYLYSGDIYA